MYVDDASRLPKCPPVAPSDLAVAARFVIAANDGGPEVFVESLTPDLRNRPLTQLLLLMYDVRSSCTLHLSQALDICCWMIGSTEGTHQGSPDDQTWQATVERARQIVAGDAA